MKEKQKNFDSIKPLFMSDIYCMFHMGMIREQFKIHDFWLSAQRQRGKELITFKSLSHLSLIKHQIWPLSH